jgi:hypothetical protein
MTTKPSLGPAISLRGRILSCPRLSASLFCCSGSQIKWTDPRVKSNQSHWIHFGTPFLVSTHANGGFRVIVSMATVLKDVVDDYRGDAKDNPKSRQGQDNVSENLSSVATVSGSRGKNIVARPRDQFLVGAWWRIPRSEVSR